MTSVDEIIPLLRKVSLFEGLPDEDLKRMAEAGEVRAFSEGETLFEEGDEGDAFYVVVEGAVEIARRRAGGAQERLAVRRAGQAFGEMALLDDATRSATARTTQDSRLLVLDRSAFHRLLDPDSAAFRMLTSLSKALRALDVRFTAQETRAAGEGVEHFNALLRQGILPVVAPSVDGFEIAAGSSLTEDGTGDSAWDVLPLSGGGVALAVLQVRGDGLPPAHQLAVARAVLRTVARRTASPDELLREASEAFSDLTVEGVEQFVECALVVPEGDSVLWAAAGRCPAVSLGGEGKAEELSSPGSPLGISGTGEFGPRRVTLPPGGAVFVLSRGSRGLLKGAGDLVASLGDKPAAEVVSTVHRALAKARPEALDTTAVLVRRER